MLNVNSPTVQAMLQQTPQGFGNIPLYSGNPPTITTETVGAQEVQNYSQFPYPSPKEMITAQGMNAIYSPTPFQPRNIVGGYNSGYQTAFNGYQNPYIGYGSSYGGGYVPYQYAQMDQETIEVLRRAEENGLTYDEQIVEDSELLKTISRIVSKNLKRSEKEAKKCEERWDIYKKAPDPSEYNPFSHNNKPKKESSFVIDVVVDGNTICCKSENNIRQDYNINAASIEYMIRRQQAEEINRINYHNYLYDNAIERKMDKMDLADFFTTGIGELMADLDDKKAMQQRLSMVGAIYNKNGFRERLLANNNIRTRSQMKAIDRYASRYGGKPVIDENGVSHGTYGIMPDGRPVSPGHDPRVAECFSFDPNTGTLNITAPDFSRYTSDKVNEARRMFIDHLNKE